MEQAPPEEFNNDNNNSNDNVESQGGVWGKRSRKEVCAVVFVAVIALVGLTAGLVVFGISKSDDDSDSSDSSNKDHTPVQTHLFGPQHEPITAITSPQLKLELLRRRFQEFDLTRALLTTLPENATDIQGKEQDVTAEPHVRAAAWLLHKDTHNQEFQLIRRYALATIYYANGGAQWTDSTNWLSSEKSHCEWKGISCCGEPGWSLLPVCRSKPYSAIAEVDLYKNNVDGQLHDVMIFLQDVQSIFLNKNALTGEINGEMISQLPDLIKLYLQHNQLNGTIPVILKNNQKLDTLYLQGNEITGKFPAELCPSCRYCLDNLVYFGVDCPQVECAHACCKPWTNCFETDKELN